jgi:hypothetical protein
MGFYRILKKSLEFWRILKISLRNLSDSEQNPVRLTPGPQRIHQKPGTGLVPTGVHNRRRCRSLYVRARKTILYIAWVGNVLQIVLLKHNGPLVNPNSDLISVVAFVSSHRNTRMSHFCVPLGCENSKSIPDCVVRVLGKAPELRLPTVCLRCPWRQGSRTSTWATDDCSSGRPTGSCLLHSHQQCVALCEGVAIVVHAGFVFPATQECKASRGLPTKWSNHIGPSRYISDQQGLCVHLGRHPAVFVGGQWWPRTLSEVPATAGVVCSRLQQCLLSFQPQGCWSVGKTEVVLATRIPFAWE